MLTCLVLHSKTDSGSPDYGPQNMAKGQHSTI